MKNVKPFKTGMFYGIGMSVFSIIRGLYSTEEYTFMIVLKLIFAGLISGFFAALFVGLGLTLYNKMRTK